VLREVKTRTLLIARNSQIACNRTWLNIHIPSFFATCEEQEDPVLQGRPVVVGDVNMVLSANETAHNLGFTAGESAYLAWEQLQNPDDIVFLKPDYAKYRGRNELVAFLLRKWDAKAESVGLDEFNIDVTDFSTRY